MINSKNRVDKQFRGNLRCMVPYSVRKNRGSDLIHHLFHVGDKVVTLGYIVAENYDTSVGLWITVERYNL